LQGTASVALADLAGGRRKHDYAAMGIGAAFTATQSFCHPVPEYPPWSHAPCVQAPRSGEPWLQCPVASKSLVVENGMVELTLPKNSKIKQGKTWPKPEGATKLREFRIYRYDPESESNPRVDTYFVNLDDCGPMILDAIIWIKNKIDPTLTFRRSCR